MEISSTYTNYQQKEEQYNSKTKNTIFASFPSLISDMFSVEELDKFKYTSESTLNDYLDNGAYLLKTKKYGTEDYETIYLNKTKVNEYLKEIENKVLDDDSLVNNVTYAPLSNVYSLKHKDSIGSKSYQIWTKEPITDKYLKERYDKIQSFFHNDYKKFLLEVEKYNNEIRKYNESNPSEMQKSYKGSFNRVVLNGETINIDEEEYNRHYSIYLTTRNGDSVTKDIKSNFYYQEFMNIDNRYENAPEFESMVNKLSNEGNDIFDVWRKVSLFVNLGLIPEGNQTLFPVLQDSDNASYSMQNIKNQNLEQSLINTFSSISDFRLLSIKAIFGTSLDENKFQNELNNYAKEHPTTNQKFIFNGDITIDENSSEEYKNFITNILIDFFENKKTTYKDETPSIPKATREYYTSQVIERFQLLIDNLKLTINKKEEENNNLIYQYTKNTKVNPLNSIL
ncbi:hypothetical protein [Aliarcobacter butzleri]|uniref:hypothetical protein n=1 Tax=Aliarcobacter butzleri TaxID=28197 RepID=UPI0021B25D35|nr:hypothetical protein [Aliarcobacter butzleri]MCT7557622.1 hypothetical protein [Aliarcobacter butzleri]